MKFFEDCRPQFYFDGGRLYKDKKTGKKMWALKIIIPLDADLVTHCDAVITNNYIAIETRENRVEEIVMSHQVDQQIVEFFGLEDKTAPITWVTADIIEIRLTRDENLTELHFKIECELTPILHRFVGEHVFNRLWVQFADAQGSLPLGAPKKARTIPKDTVN